VCDQRFFSGKKERRTTVSIDILVDVGVHFGSKKSRCLWPSKVFGIREEKKGRERQNFFKKQDGCSHTQSRERDEKENETTERRETSPKKVN
jgi:hypothetical protein